MINSYKYLLFSLLLFIFSCALDVPEDAFEYLAPPAITCYLVAGDTEHIYVDYTGYNDEYYFQGYNVYVSETAMLRASVATYTAVQVVGCASCTSSGPSFPLPPSGSQTGTIILYQHWCIDDPSSACPFTDGVKYYIMLGSYHKELKVNEDGVSNQVSITFSK